MIVGVELIVTQTQSGSPATMTSSRAALFTLTAYPNITDTPSKITSTYLADKILTAEMTRVHILRHGQALHK